MYIVYSFSFQSYKTKTKKAWSLLLLLLKNVLNMFKVMYLYVQRLDNYIFAFLNPLKYLFCS